MKAIYKEVVIFGLVLVSLFIIIPIMAHFNSQAGNKKSEKADTGAINPLTETFDGLAMLGNVTSVDLNTMVINVRFDMEPFGSLAIEESASNPYSRMRQAGRLILNKANTTLAAQSALPFLTQSVPIVDGNLNLYPFDTYYAYLTMSLVVGESISPRLPIGISLSSAIQAWNVDVNIYDGQEQGGMLLIEFVATRASTTKVFSIAVASIMWMISLTVLYLAVSVWTRGRRVEPPTIAVAGALVFALPALRNSQPGAPVIGATIDVAGFFWNMALTSVALLLLMINYVVKYKAEKKDDLALPSADRSLSRSPTKFYAGGTSRSSMRFNKQYGRRSTSVSPIRTGL